MQQSIRNAQPLKPDKHYKNKMRQEKVPDASYLNRQSDHKIITKVPAVISSIPMSFFIVNCSWRIRKARITVRTILSLSTGITLEASPI